MNVLARTEQFRKCLQLFASSLNDELALEIPSVFDEWEVGKNYHVGNYLTYGVNAVGDPQLYKVVSIHTSQTDWTPDKVPALYEALGLDENGVPVWSAPSGAHDAYNTGDIVNYNGVIKKSLIDGNCTTPDNTQFWGDV